MGISVTPSMAQVQVPDTIFWTRLIANAAKNGRHSEAMELFRKMQWEGVMPDPITFVTLVNVCGSMRSLAEGKCVHASLAQSGYETNLILGTALVNMYSKCDSMGNARAMFDRMYKPDVVAWNSMIAAYAQRGYQKPVVQLFQQMQLEGTRPNDITLVNVLNAFASPTGLAHGKLIHANIVDESNTILGNALIKMYDKCQSLEDARRTFDEMDRLDLISWTAIIAAYAEREQSLDALQLFRSLLLQGLLLDRVVFVAILNACSGPAALRDGRFIHSCVIESGFELDKDVGSALVNMYAKCGTLEDVQRMFDRMPHKDVILWTTVITAHATHRQYKACLGLFGQMQLEGVMPNHITLITVVDACAGLAAVLQGKAIYSRAICSGYDSQLPVRNAVLHMYGQCGCLEEVRAMFKAMVERNVISWNAIIAAYAQHGHSGEALMFFRQMQQDGVTPNTVTFVSIITACSHAGLVDDGCNYFAALSEDYEIVPTDKHFGCMIDMLARAGHLDDAEDMILNIAPDDAQAWMALLGACRSHGDIMRAKRAAERVLKLNRQSSPAHVVLSNMYSLESSGITQTLGASGTQECLVQLR